MMMFCSCYDRRCWREKDTTKWNLEEEGNSSCIKGPRRLRYGFYIRWETSTELIWSQQHTTWLQLPTKELRASFTTKNLLRKLSACVEWQKQIREHMSSQFRRGVLSIERTMETIQHCSKQHRDVSEWSISASWLKERPYSHLTRYFWLQISAVLYRYAT